MDEQYSTSMEKINELTANQKAFVASSSGLAVMTICSGPPKITSRPVSHYTSSLC